MPKVPGDLWNQPTRGVSMRGVGTLKMVGGRAIATPWPKARGAPRTIKEANAQTRFQDVNRATLYMDSYQQDFAASVARACNLLPRDLLVAAAYGRLVCFRFPDKIKVFSVASRNEISQILDAIAQLPGALVLRGENWWGALDAGTPGEVLTIDPLTGMPAWAPATGGTNLRSMTLRTTSTGPSNTTWPKYISWDAADLADWTGWSASDPERIVLPDDASRFRWNLTWRTAYTANVQSWSLGLATPSGTVALSEYGQSYPYQSTGQFNDGFVAGYQSGWFEADDLPEFRCRVHCSQNRSTGWAANTILTVEVV